MRITKLETSHRSLALQQTPTLARATSWLLVLLVLVAATPTTLNGQSSKVENGNHTVRVSEGRAFISSTGFRTKTAEHPDNEENQTRKVIVGSWIETVTFSGAGAPPPFKSLVTFGGDGAVLVADQGNVNTAAGTVFSAGHGRWVALGNRTFTWTIMELMSDLNGNLLGTLKVRGTYTVDESGNAYNGSFQADLTDIFDNVFSFEGTNEGHRIQVEPLP